MAKGDAKKALALPPHVRVLQRVREDVNGCWLWPGAVNGPERHRYGVIMTGSRSDGTRRGRPTHVVVYEALVGPIPDGLELDHLCRRTLCCNPAHLEPVTHLENARRAVFSELERQRRREWMYTLLARKAA